MVKASPWAVTLALPTKAEGTDPLFKEGARLAIVGMRKGAIFIAQDLRMYLDETGFEVKDLRALGPIILQAKAEGLIVKAQDAPIRDQWGSWTSLWRRTGVRA